MFSLRLIASGTHREAKVYLLFFAVRLVLGDGISLPAVRYYMGTVDDWPLSAGDQQEKAFSSLSDENSHRKFSCSHP